MDMHHKSELLQLATSGYISAIYLQAPDSIGILLIIVDESRNENVNSDIAFLGSLFCSQFTIP